MSSRVSAQPLGSSERGHMDALLVTLVTEGCNVCLLHEVRTQEVDFSWS